MEDERIVDLYWLRDEEAIAESERKYGRYCFKVAFNILHDRSDTEDCLNETWLKAWESIPPNRPDKLNLYLGRITRNLALNLHEKLTAEKRGGNQTSLILDELSEVIGRPSDVEENWQVSMLRDAINAFLGGLDQKSRTVFVRRYWYMASVNEIALSMLMTPSNVKMTLKRTRDRLQNYLQQEGFVE